MTFEASLLDFPIRTKNKDHGWVSSYDDTFDDFIDTSQIGVEANPLWDSDYFGSSFGLDKNISHECDMFTHHAGSISMEKLTRADAQPFPLHVQEDHWAHMITVNDEEDAPADATYSQSISATLPGPAVHSASRGLSDSDLELLSPKSMKHEQQRGRTRAGAQQSSATRTRNPSGVRKTLRTAKSTPNMLHTSMQRTGCSSVPKLRQQTPPPVPKLDKLWAVRDVKDQLQSHTLQHGDSTASTISPLAEKLQQRVSPSKHFKRQSPPSSPLFEPYELINNSHARHDLKDVHTIDFGKSSFRDERDEFWIHEYNASEITSFPSNSLRARTNAHAPPTFTLNSASSKGMPIPMIMSAPLLEPTNFGLGIRGDLDRLYLPSSSEDFAAEMNVSPRTTTITTMPNFSLPYRNIPPRPINAGPKASSSHNREPTQDGLESRPERRGRHHHRRAKSAGPSNGSSDGGGSERARSQTPGATTARAKREASRGRQRIGGRVNGFVNLTPHDSEKLLTGVAPSGSTKTKAKREREALERKRRLSQAAVRAVVEGDLERLREVGFEVDG